MFTKPHRLLGGGIAILLALAACTQGTVEEPGTSTTQASTTTAAQVTTTTPAGTLTTEAMVDPVGFEAQVELYTTMRNLWTDHMQWTWATVDAFFHNPDGLGPQLDRLLVNQADIGSAIVPFYGQEAGDQLTALLTTHIEQAVPVLTAAQAGDQEALDQALADWYANAEEIADFLSAANPDNWPQSATRPMMEAHIDTTTVYAVDLLSGDYVAAVLHYDEALEHMTMLADALSAGIITQFPDRFAG
ncbi:MAG TPA: hypothetical protein VJQ57_14760 [Acidimicrobiia bacterium]|nr:hypothetical protein [Acidimicrobiia bacterium]